MRAALGRFAVFLALLSLAPAGPLRAGPAAESWGVPVLMYHLVDTHPPAQDPVTVHLTVLAPAFEAQLRLLSDRGYRAVTLDELWAALLHHAPLPPRGVALTFDDGYEDNYTVAFPLLRRYEFVATFFVVTSTVGTPGHLTVAQIQEMARSGMAIESHGVHHIDFSRLPLAIARTELIRSRRTIEAWTGRPVAFFAYPSGRFTRELERLLGDLGYRGALTEVPGFVRPGSAPYALDRVRIDHDDSLATFARGLGIPRP